MVTWKQASALEMFNFFFLCGSLKMIHTFQLNFLFSDWLFSKYAECIENVHCTPRLREVLLVRDRVRERHIN